MPKVYSDKEREIITASLRFHAAQCLSTYGIKRTTVDELVRRAKIPKGTFYLFYPSKESLLFEVFIQWHNSLQEELIHTIAAGPQPVTVDALTEILFALCQKVDETGMLAILSNGEIEALFRKLPDELIAEHLTQDHDMTEDLIQLIPAAAGKDAAAFSAAFRGIFFMLLYKDEIGEHFDAAMKISIRGLLLQLWEETDND